MKNVDNKPKSLTLIWVDLLGDRFEVVRFDGGERVKITHPPTPHALSNLKLVRIKLETPNLARTYAVLLVLENIPFSTKTLLVLFMSAFFAKNLCFLAKIVPLLKAIVGELH